MTSEGQCLLLDPKFIDFFAICTRLGVNQNMLAILRTLLPFIRHIRLYYRFDLVATKLPIHG
jgi:hypothetical protein